MSLRIERMLKTIHLMTSPSKENSPKDLAASRFFKSHHGLDSSSDFFFFNKKKISDEKGVLVHCFAVQSQSASMIIAYLMRTEKLSREDALTSLKQRAHALKTPKCKAKVGSFDWSGSYCSCGSKIVPAFQIQMSRVDVITAKDDVKKKHKKKRV
ncbi:unnamed protein product [Arabidopsis lyrata]|uniref:protein-tyrosine-phosphatase n=1 Tax=Arabidopsis lyrata subsp. lyrata TaxID=81972 RepID=D7M3U4_ARALL|nr:predicted protein [Arabidopsis lyrata subsp. lyrata]CAH8272175.1 unnamed protein product [Arabidopsis lyrata]